MVAAVPAVVAQTTSRLMVAPLVPGQELVGQLGNSDADILRACELFQQVFGHAVDVNAWRWKYQHGPRIAGFNIVARAPDGSQLLGHVGASAFHGRWGGQNVVMVQVADVMVHPQARSGHQPANLYRRLMSTLQAEVHRVLGDQPTVLYGFPGERPSKLGQRVGLYRSLYFCAEHSLPGSSSARSGWSWRLRGHQVQQVPWSQADTWVTALAQQPQHAYTQPVIRKTTAYLLWRYATNPHHSYQLWVHTRWGQPHAWWVTRPDLPGTIIDAAWPALGAVNAKALSRFTSATQMPKVGTWVLPEGHQATEPPIPTPINAVEIAGLHGWHPGQPQPRFHPGDTDVF